MLLIDSGTLHLYYLRTIKPNLITVTMGGYARRLAMIAENPPPEHGMKLRYKRNRNYAQVFHERQERRAEKRKRRAEKQMRRAEKRKRLQREKRDNRPTVQSISSKNAADLIESASKEGSKLLIITADASAGKRTSGSAAILRLCTEGPTDTVKAVVQHHRWAESSPAEIAAVALGCTWAVDNIDVLEGCRVLLLSDSSSTLDFYCQSSSKNPFDTLLYAEDYFSAVKELSDAGVSNICMAHVKSNHKVNIGFFDHSAADRLASVARRRPSAAANFEHTWVDAPPLQAEDLTWLRSQAGQSHATSTLDRLREDLGIGLPFLK